MLSQKKKINMSYRIPVAFTNAYVFNSLQVEEEPANSGEPLASGVGSFATHVPLFLLSSPS